MKRSTEFGTEASGMDDVTVYKKANIDRKVFSRIRCKKDYKPTKKTAVAFAIALQLDMPAMLDLLSRAEIAFSPSSKFDLIITYFVTNKVYDIYEINAALSNMGSRFWGRDSGEWNLSHDKRPLLFRILIYLQHQEFEGGFNICMEQF